MALRASILTPSPVPGCALRLQTACSADALAGLSCVRTQCQAWEITLRLPTARA
uniref:Uncharacterized protein n=1 Tax=Pseudomonas syringae pv. actinidiae TaxID=103796 RepID=A0A2P0QF71_PSESF|nr:hypothetical protein [Pseudomonas syringae pv. actinidiae]ARO45025.1 hypothetical protein [Pseudomonas syringae pv. actinidiae]